MDAGLIDRIETTAERLASALFAAAMGYAVYRWLAAVVHQPAPGLCAGVAAAMAYLVCYRSLKAAAQHDPQLGLPTFDLREISAFFADDELLLTEADRLHDELLLTEADRLDGELLLTDADRVQAGAEPLELDDMLAQLGPDARVVRLFDRKTMPTPGELQSRIDSHVGKRPSPTPPADDSQALFAALAELRRSLR